MEMIIGCLSDALMDSIKLIPFLFIIYIILEFISRRSSLAIYEKIANTRFLGPLLGGIIGVVPQCGLSAAAASLYIGKIVSLGTMLAVFLSASDDMLPILISSAVNPVTIVKILACKVLMAVISGYLVDMFWRKKHERELDEGEEEIEIELNGCGPGCNCEENFWWSVIKHTIQVFAFIFIISLVLNIVIEGIGEETLGSLFRNVPILGEFVAAIIGLIPNCASSVIITELYLEGVMSAGALFAGLLVNTGVGTLVLIRFNKNRKESLKIIGLLYCIGVVWGILLELVGIVF